jgi:hypothetical protein
MYVFLHFSHLFRVKYAICIKCTIVC